MERGKVSSIALSHARPGLTPVSQSLTDSGQSQRAKIAQSKRAQAARAAAHHSVTALVNVYRLRPTSHTHTRLSHGTAKQPFPTLRHHALARTRAQLCARIAPAHPRASQPPPSVSARTHAHVPTPTLFEYRPRNASQRHRAATASALACQHSTPSLACRTRSSPCWAAHLTPW